MSVLPPISLRTVLLCLVWYLVLSFTSQVTKVILGKLAYPFFLSQAQFLIGTLLSYAFITLIRRYPNIRDGFSPGVVPHDLNKSIFNRKVLLTVMPLGILQFVGKYFSLSATLIVPVATVASVKSLSPMLIVGGYRVFYNVRFPVVTYLLLTPLLAGVIMMIMVDAEVTSPELASSEQPSGEQSNPLFLPRLDEEHVRGLIYCIISAIIMACQHIYGKELITWDKLVRTNPVSLVLNTDASRPATPGGLNTHNVGSPDNLLRGLLPMSLARHFTQRRDAVRLPYSMLDLRLDELHQQNQPLPQSYPLPHLLPNPLTNHYFKEVQEGKTATNPLAQFVPSHGAAKPEKFTVIFFISLIGFCFSFSGFLVNEAGSMLSSIRDPSLFHGSLQDKKDVFLVALLIVMDSLSHFVQTVLAFILLGSIPALSYSIASMLKRIVIILVSILLAVDASLDGASDKWFGRISSQQIRALGLIAIGLYCYDRWGSRSLKENRT